MMKTAFATLALAAMTMTAHAGVIFQEGFDDVPGLAAKGWTFANASTPGGLTSGWFQGNSGAFNAQSGAPDSYAAANFYNAPPGGSIDSWLYTPTFDASGGAEVSFYLRAAGEGYSDKVSYGFEGAGGMTTVFPVPDAGWTLYTAHLDSGQAGTTRFGFRYFGDEADANYVGLDSLTVVPEPGSIALLAGGMLAFAVIRRRTRT
jgi:hypothetical protein